MTSTESNSAAVPGSRDKYGLCLLSLGEHQSPHKHSPLNPTKELLDADGGGVRGLSTLLILKGLMRQINAKRRLQGLSYVKPCDVFDLIGGTSTGG